MGECIVIQEEHHAPVGTLSDHAGLTPLSGLLDCGRALIAVHYLEGRCKARHVGVPLTSPTYGGVGDVAQGAVASCDLSREIGEFTAQPAIGVIDAYKTCDNCHGGRYRI